jgi:very-short-patch-repair endonuclease
VPNESAQQRRQFKQRIAQTMRQAPTDAERLLWACLRNKRFAPLRFRRQQPIGPYVVDFYCSAVKCIIELDGSQHGERDTISYDAARTKWLEERGYRVLRMWNGDLLCDLDAALEYIWREVMRSSSTPPRFASQIDPPSRGG